MGVSENNASDVRNYLLDSKTFLSSLTEGLVWTIVSCDFRVSVNETVI